MAQLSIVKKASVLVVVALSAVATVSAQAMAPAPSPNAGAAFSLPASDQLRSMVDKDEDLHEIPRGVACHRTKEPTKFGTCEERQYDNGCHLSSNSRGSIVDNIGEAIRKETWDTLN
ncbi:unnamed protein product [Lactuca saligna]|uniref:Uncharacterized protein n=1 Tax=Lactuca saligna TaxID=75948 RepID=A0AA36EME9_LACSI|nr:unnamed protein product [Lactuca saligna]